MELRGGLGGGAGGALYNVSVWAGLLYCVGGWVEDILTEDCSRVQMFRRDILFELLVVRPHYRRNLTLIFFRVLT